MMTLIYILTLPLQVAAGVAVGLGYVWGMELIEDHLVFRKFKERRN